MFKIASFSPNIFFTRCRKLHTMLAYSSTIISSLACSQLFHCIVHVPKTSCSMMEYTVKCIALKSCELVDQTCLVQQPGNSSLQIVIVKMPSHYEMWNHLLRSAAKPTTWISLGGLAVDRWQFLFSHFLRWKLAETFQFCKNHPKSSPGPENDRDRLFSQQQSSAGLSWIEDDDFVWSHSTVELFSSVKSNLFERAISSSRSFRWHFLNCFIFFFENVSSLSCCRENEHQGDYICAVSVYFWRCCYLVS